MDTLYYRRIGQIIMRDEPEQSFRAAAERALATSYDKRARIARADRRLLKTWMRAWCDRTEAAFAATR